MSQMENKPSQPGPNMAMPMGMGMGMPGGTPVGMGPGVAARQMPPAEGKERQLLHTYIYDYFLKNNMFDCAHSMIKSPDADVSTEGPYRRSPRAKHEGEMNGMDDDVMDSGDGSNQRDGDEEPKSIKDLPLPKVPADGGSFLFDWWCCFMDIFYARNKMNSSLPAQTYVANAQANHRLRQEQMMRMNPQGHAMMSGQVPSQMMNAQGYPNRLIPSGMIPNGAMHGQDGPGGPGDVNKQQHQQMIRTAMNNRLGGNRGPAPMNALNKPMMQHMQRGDGEVNEMNGQARPQSPAAAASPGAKRLRLENGEYQQVGTGRGTPQGMPPGSSAGPGQQLAAHGLNPQLSTAQFAAIQGQNPSAQQRLYAQSMAAATGRGMHNLQGGPMQQKGMQMGQPGSSPMMPQTSEGAAGMNEFYATTPGGGMRTGGGTLTGTGSNHALQDYQIQLMLLEQQNKKRLLMARQEQDQIAHHGDGQRRMEQPGQFQNAMSPGSRPAPSPQPGGKPNMGTPKMPNQIPGSPAPGEGPMGGPMQQRNSPASAAGFNGPMGQDGYQMMHGLKDQMGNPIPGGMPNGQTAIMRPPSSHPGQQFNAGGMGQADMQQPMNPGMVRPPQAGRGQPPVSANMWQPQHPGGMPAQQAQQQQAQQQQLQQLQQQQQQQQQQAQQAAQQAQQAGGPSQGQTPQQVGTPQQPQRQLPHGAMPPPPGPTTAPANGRPAAPASPQVTNNQPPTPTPSNKPAPGKKAPRDANAKKPRPKKGAPAAPAPSAVTPSSEPPTPTTPITPQHPSSFAGGASHPRTNNFTSGGANPSGNGQPPQQPTPNPAPAVPPAPVAQDTVPATGFGGLGGGDDLNSFMEFGAENGADSLLDNFDFDSFLNTEDNPALALNGDFQWATDAVETGAGDA